WCEDGAAMSEHAWLAVYCVLVLIGSTMGGFLPFLGKITHDRLQFYLSISAGVMLGASFFHVMPEAMEYAGGNFGWWMPLGVVGLSCLERFSAPHSPGMDGGRHDHGPGGHHHHDHNHGHDHAHEHGGAADAEHPLPATKEPGDRRSAAPAVAGWMAV